jgi:hypothetical protein
MGHKPAEPLLNRITATLAEQRELIVQAEKRLMKSPNQKTALVIRSEIEELHTQVDALKVRRKALKRGIVPEELGDEKSK